MSNTASTLKWQLTLNSWSLQSLPNELKRRKPVFLNTVLYEAVKIANLIKSHPLNMFFNFSVTKQLLLNCSVMSNSLRPHGLQHTRLPCPSPLPELAQTHVHRVGDAIQPSHSLSSPSPPAFNLFQHIMVFSNESALHISWPKIWSFSLASVLPMNILYWFQYWLVWSPCRPRDSQEYYPIQQF